MCEVEVKDLKQSFNPLDRGNLYLIWAVDSTANLVSILRFNPLDRGNLYLITSRLMRDGEKAYCFNPLDRGNLYLIQWTDNNGQNRSKHCFNPLDRGNLYLIIEFFTRVWDESLFQSPRSGKFVSNKTK